MRFFNFFSKIPEQEEPKLTLENLVEFSLLSKEEVLKIKKDRAIKEWETETGEEQEKKRSHHS